MAIAPEPGETKCPKCSNAMVPMLVTKEEGQTAASSAPTSERQSLERERAELPSQIAAYESKLEATPHEHTASRGSACSAASARCSVVM